MQNTSNPQIDCTQDTSQEKRCSRYKSISNRNNLSLFKPEPNIVHISDINYPSKMQQISLNKHLSSDVIAS